MRRRNDEIEAAARSIAESLGLVPPEDPTRSRVEAAFVGKFHSQTEIQRQVGNSVRSGRSVLLVAPTASGKTEAAVMAGVETVMRNGGALLYLAPTRALINDLLGRMEGGFSSLGLTVVARHGEAHPTADALRSARAIISTLESLEVALEKREPWVDSIRFLVIDELHNIEGQPRGAQLRALVGRLERLVGTPIQRVAVSATVATPAAVARYWGPAGESLDIISQPDGRSRVVQVLAGDADWLRTWLGSSAPAKIIIFANSRRHCDELFTALSDASDHVLFVHYSNIEQSMRRETEASLRRLQRVAVIATSTLELGIDIGDLDAVVLADAPWSALAYVQRVGRAGRRAEVSHAVALTASDRGLLRLLATSSVPPGLSDDDGVAARFHSVAVQQTLCLMAGRRHGRIRVQHLEEAMEATGLLQGGEASDLLEHMRREGVLDFNTQLDAYRLADSTERLMSGPDRWGNFPEDRARWELRSKGKYLARVNVSGRPEIGRVLLFAGRFWAVRRLERGRLDLMPTGGVPDPMRTSYDDVAPIVPGLIADQMSAIASAKVDPVDADLTPPVKARLMLIRDAIAQALPANVLVNTQDQFRLLTFAGTRANLLLAAYLHASRADEVGIEVAEFDPRSLNGVTSDDVLKVASARWEWLSGRLAVTKWFPYLPANLRRDEVMTQLKGSGVGARLDALLARPATALTVPGLSL